MKLFIKYKRKISVFLTALMLCMSMFSIVPKASETNSAGVIDYSFSRLASYCETYTASSHYYYCVHQNKDGISRGATLIIMNYDDACGYMLTNSVGTRLLRYYRPSDTTLEVVYCNEIGDIKHQYISPPYVYSAIYDWYLEGYNCPPVTASCNFPVFSSESEMIDYLNTRDDSAKVNSDYFDSITSYSEDIPVVENAYLTYNYVSNESLDAFTVWINFDFPQGREDLTAEVYGAKTFDIYRCSSFNTKKLETKRFTTTSMKWGDIPYQSDSVHMSVYGTGSVDAQLNEFVTGLSDQVRNSNEYKELKDKCSLFQTVLYEDYEYIFVIRLTDGKHYGKWVRVKVNRDGVVSTEITGGDSSLGATEETAGGDTEIVGGDTSVDDVVSGGGTVDDSYHIDASIDTPQDLSSEELLNTIKTMFSDNGVVGIVKAVFGFMPPWLVAFVSLFFTLLIALLIIRFVRG